VSVHATSTGRMLSCDYTFGDPPEGDPNVDVYVRGSWDQIERAGDLLSDTDYQRLFEVTAARRVASRR
jgi:hypothetical protein